MSAGSSRLTMSEPRVRPTWQRRADAEDNHSVASSTRNSDCRPNNWQSVDWPQTTNLNGLRREQKKANQERQQENEVQEGDPGRSPSQEGAARLVPTRPPATYPRLTAPITTQRNDMDSVRQRLSLSEADEPDSNQIVGRLMQIRDYIKQTQAMMTRAHETTNINSRESHSKLKSLIENLKEQEKGYLGLLQKVLASREEGSLLPQLTNHSKTGPASDVTSELDVQSSISTETQDEDMEEDRAETSGQRPMIEGRLGIDSDGDPADVGVTNDLTGRSPGLDATLTASHELNDLHGTTDILLDERQRLETDLTSKNNELQSLREQHMLLKEMLDQQEQLRSLQNHQAALMALQKEAENQLDNGTEMSTSVTQPVRPVHYEGSVQSSVNPQAMDTVIDNYQPQSMAMLPESMSDRLNELHQKMHQLESCFGAEDRDAERNTEDLNESDRQSVEVESIVSYERQQLQDKLVDLQDKKQHMDQLLGELQTLRDDHVTVTTAPDPDMLSRPAGSDMVQGSHPTGHTPEDVHNMLQMMEVRGKLKKLESVKGRLDELRELVHYYQTNNDQYNPDGEDKPDTSAARVDKGTSTVNELKEVSSQPQYSDYEDPISSDQPQDVAVPGNRVALQMEDLEQILQHRVSASNQPEADFMSDISSDFGAWGDDPDVKEKVRRLKAAKEKLHRLQSLITMVQHSPEKLQCLPDDLALLAASLEDHVDQRHTQAPSTRWPPDDDDDGDDDDAELAMSSPHAVAAVAGQRKVATSIDPHPSEEMYEAKMREQQGELELLMEERQKILAIQHDLQRLHDVMPNTADATDEFVNTNLPRRSPEQHKGHQDLNTDIKSAQEAVQVTFGEPLETVISNEELYGQMRQQRILREELREKKKELEQFMKKDRPKKHYFRNQDNQSDNISYSNKSDQFGASASEDVTMATWGGSTAGPLESIEENGSGEGHNMEECDDGYPSDGIVQVEEEEEEEVNDDSDDRDTYTIEEEYQPRARQPLQSPIVQDNGRRRIRRKVSKGAPFQESADNKVYSYNQWASDHKHMLNNAKRPKYKTPKSAQTGKRKMKRDHAIEEELCSLREQVQYLTSRYQGDSDIGSPRMYSSHVTPAMPSQGLFRYQPSQVYDQELVTALSTLSERIASLERNQTSRNPVQQSIDSHGYGLSPSSVHSQGGLPQYSARPGSFELAPQFPESFSAEAYGGGASWMQADNGPESGRRNNTAPYEEVRVNGGPLRSQPTVIAHNQHPAPRGMEDVHPSTRGTEGMQHAPLVAEALKPSSRIHPSTRGADDIHSRVSAGIHISTRTEILAPPRSRPCVLQQSLDHPIETVHAANEQAIRDHCATRHALNTTKTVNVPNRFGSRDTMDMCKNNLTNDATQDDVVIAQRFSTPMRATTGAHLADQQLCDLIRTQPPPHDDSTSAMETASGSTAVSSTYSTNDLKRHKTMNTRSSGTNHIDSEATIGVNNFESLRESIYAEVATLISRNEGHPHFLIELFRQLQELDSDYLRQRVLYAIQDLIFNRLTEEQVRDFKPPATWSENPLAVTGEELTPSESLMSSIDDDNKHEGSDDDMRAESIHSDRFDYAENVETTSSMSTPSTGDSNLDNPFAGETLGDTVIHLDSALRKMRDYELKLTESDSMDVMGVDMMNVPMRSTDNAQQTEASALDPTSDGSTSDIPCARIDTSLLDAQIKGIMAEIVPVLKEHSGEVCSQQLLQYIKRLVLLLTKQQDQQQENAKFFESQLGSIVHDSLAKFEGRKLQECGEDLLVDLSEILFNELAFFKLMQDLNDPKAKVKASFQQWNVSPQKRTPHALPGQPSQTDDAEHNYSSDYEDSSSSSSTSGDEDDDEGDEEDAEDEDEEGGSECSEGRPIDNDNTPASAGAANDDEDLGKLRDDELARQCNVEESQEDEESGPMSAMKIELAPSETKPYTRIGSDEDDDGEDESANNDEPSDTAVARDAQNSCSDDDEQSDLSGVVTPSTAECQSPMDSPPTRGSPTAEQPVEELSVVEPDDEQDSAKDDEPAATTNSPKKDEDPGNSVPGAFSDELAMDDLPVKLTGLSQEELTKQMETDELVNDLPVTVDDIVPEMGGELAGDPLAAKPPGNCNGLT